MEKSDVKIRDGWNREKNFGEKTELACRDLFFHFVKKRIWHRHHLPVFMHFKLKGIINGMMCP